MKKVMSFIICIAVLFSIIVTAEAVNQGTVSSDSGIVVKVDGKVIAFPDARPYINEDNRTLVPVRFVSEALGAEVDWQGSTQLVTISKGSTRIALKIGDSFAIVNNSASDSKVSFDTKAILKDSRTFVPLRFVSEALDCTVDWDATTGAVSIVSQPGTSQDGTQSIYEDFDLIKGANPPADFIVPQFRIHHTSPSDAVYFNIELVNIMAYKDTASNYTYKIECVNHPELNKSQMIRPDGSADKIYDETRIRNMSIMFNAYTKTPFYITALPKEYYTTFELAKTFSITPGMDVTYKITYSNIKDNFQQVYEKTIAIR